MDIEILSNVLKVLLEFLLLGYAVVKFKKLQVKSMKYLIAALLAIVVSDVFNLIFWLGFKAMDQLYWIKLVLANIPLLLGLYLILIFMETFSKDNPFHGKNALIGVILACNSAILFVTAIELTYFGNHQNLGGFLTYEIGSSEIEEIQQILSVVFDVSYLFSTCLTIFVIFRIFHILKKKETASINPQFKKALKKLNLGIKIIILAVILEFVGTFFYNSFYWIFSILGFLNETFGYFVLIYIYLREGIYVLQEDQLRYIIIIDSAGIPVYSFDFSRLNRNIKNHPALSVSEEMLFTGALNATSSMISHLIGSNQQLKEVHLDSTVVMVKQSRDQQYTVVLFTDQSSSFYYNCLDEFTTQFFEAILDIPKIMRLNGQNLQIADSLIMKYFGFNRVIKKSQDYLRTKVDLSAYIKV